MRAQNPNQIVNPILNDLLNQLNIQQISFSTSCVLVPTLTTSVTDYFVVLRGVSDIA